MNFLEWDELTLDEKDDFREQLFRGQPVVGSYPHRCHWERVPSWENLALPERDQLWRCHSWFGRLEDGQSCGAVQTLREIDRQDYERFAKVYGKQEELPVGDTFDPAREWSKD